MHSGFVITLELRASLSLHYLWDVLWAEKPRIGCIFVYLFHAAWIATLMAKVDKLTDL